MSSGPFWTTVATRSTWRPEAAIPTGPVEFGGPLALALVAAEVSALAAHIDSLASVVRAVADDLLLDEFSAVTWRPGSASLDRRSTRSAAGP